jgi:hypothetical protein
MDIDAVIAEATKVAEPAQASPEAKIETAPEAQEVSQEKPADTGNVEAQDLQKKADHELTPEQLAKREANRQSHLNSKLAKLRRENRELREANERSAKPQTQEAKPSNDGRPAAPKPEAFRTWGEYEDARDAYVEQLADWKLDRKLAERDTKNNQTAESVRAEQEKLFRAQQATKTIDEVAKQNPDYSQLINEHADFLNNIPPHIDDAFLMAENPGLALYALMKEGNLEALEDMPKERVLMEIGKAELRGMGYLNRNKATNAPAPISASRGTGSTSKSLESMSVEDLLKKFNSR